MPTKKSVDKKLLTSIQESKKRYYEKNKELVIMRSKLWKASNKEKVLLGSKSYYNKNKDKAKQYRDSHKETSSQYSKQYYEANKERLIQYAKDYENNPDKKELLSQRRKAYAEKNKLKIQEYKHAYYKKNKIKCLEKARRNNAKRVAIDPSYKIRKNLSSRIYKAVKSFHSKKADTTIALLECSPMELKTHIERQWEDGMTWENYGLKGWHIDHIKPCSSFNLVDPLEQKKCFHFSNLQPLWALENLRKSGKVGVK